jgi:hypothetical protein
MRTGEAALAGTAERLRALVAEGRYGEAQDCFNEYCGDFKEILRGLPPGDPRLRQMESEWRRLLEQTRRRVVAGRAHAAARLARLARRHRPYAVTPRCAGNWELLG